MEDQKLADQMALAKYAIQLSTRAVTSLTARSGTSEETLRGSLDVMHRTRALAADDPIAENLAVTMLRAAIDQLHAEGRSA